MNNEARTWEAYFTIAVEVSLGDHFVELFIC